MKLVLISVLALAVTGCASEAPKGDDPAIDDSGKADGDWCHFAFTSAEGASVRVDYTTKQTQTGDMLIDTADTVWLNVTRADLASGPHGVHVWIGDERYTQPEGYAESLQEHDLQAQPDANLDLYQSENADRFTGQLRGGMAIESAEIGDDEYDVDAHQFAIVIDTTWQTDPVSGTHNFLNTDLSVCGQ